MLLATNTKEALDSPRAELRLLFEDDVSRLRDQEKTFQNSRKRLPGR
jgi:hypothetical protein